MMPDPGAQNSIPYLRAALSRKSKTSLLFVIERYKTYELFLEPMNNTSRWTNLEIGLSPNVSLDQVVTMY